LKKGKKWKKAENHWKEPFQITVFFVKGLFLALPELEEIYKN
jgi:hypothetical protein